MQYNPRDVELILQRSYYDLITNDAWALVLGHSPDELYHRNLPDLEAFQAMYLLLRNRTLRVEDFLQEWNTTSHPGLISCNYNAKSGILQVKTRTFRFTYHAKRNEYVFVVYAKVAKAIRLIQPRTVKRYKRDKLCAVSRLTALDDELYSRYSGEMSLQKWCQSPQRAFDALYLRGMLPAIMHDAERRRKWLGEYRRLYIVLNGPEKVRIGIAEYYSPEEMQAMPVYPREAWQQGILAAFGQLERDYQAALDVHAVAMRRWSDELLNVIQHKTPYNIQGQQHLFRAVDDDFLYTDRIIQEALGNQREPSTEDHTLDFYFFSTGRAKTSASDPITEYNLPSCAVSLDRQRKVCTVSLLDEIARVLGFTPVTEIPITPNTRIDTELLDAFDQSLSQQYHGELLRQQRMASTEHARLVEAVRYIIKLSAPLVAYNGLVEELYGSYSLWFKVDEDCKIRVSADLTHSYSTETFTLDDYQDKFRVWWAQKLMMEYKYSKVCAQNPEDNHPFDIPF